MRIAVIGDGEAERAWASWIRGGPDHVLAATGDLEESLAAPGLDAAIVGGRMSDRGEALRRASAERLVLVALHPPGPDAFAYDQAAAIAETAGAVIVPDLPLRLHPGVARLRSAIADGPPGAYLSVRHEVPLVAGEDLARVTFARAVDVLRDLLGEFEGLTASGDSEGAEPVHDLLVRLRARGGRLAELRVASAADDLARLIVIGTEGSVALEYDPGHERGARLVIRRGVSTPVVEEVAGPFDPREAILDAPRRPHGPSLLDGIRAMELAEAVVRSLRRGRTIDLHAEPRGVEARFKSSMIATGCLTLVGALALYILAAVGRAMGFEPAAYLAYLIPPLLAGFLAVQLVRPAGRPEEGSLGEALPGRAGQRSRM
ncbi:hypothetical protein [Paludisphaera soli]|uniref:hypothetical protein n=1 Tax=Paludisphaera soli TaxID=2712865 RepID=UPI0013EBF1BA|nr:hypothetical protein [Paludisphaera soli]